ncbi:MAG TPA: LCCL domain-containing protein, partial [Gemmatimonadota bacterium]|nr:LCCL domain-containing protein [Gemmatimonadota bacterium]
MHGRLVHTLTLLAATAVAVLLHPVSLPAQDVWADIRTAASERTWVRNYLRRYDALLSMQAALGSTSAEAADAQLAAAGRDLYESGFQDEDLGALYFELGTAAGAFLTAVETEILTSTSWPTDLPADSYHALATRVLAQVRRSLDEALATRTDPVPALRAATRLLSYARGYSEMPATLDLFGGTDARAAAALPPIVLISIDMGTPSQPEALAGPTQPAAGGAMPALGLPGAQARGTPAFCPAPSPGGGPTTGPVIVPASGPVGGAASSPLPAAPIPRGVPGTAPPRPPSVVPPPYGGVPQAGGPGGLPPPGGQPAAGQPATGQPGMGQPAAGQPATGQVPAGVNPADGGTNAANLRGRNGQRFSFACSSGGSAGRVWGTDVYTDDSSICTAAVHAGVIKLGSGGTVTIEIRPGQDAYQASERNGIPSISYGAWPGSFVFAGAGAPSQGAFAGTIQTDRDTYAEGQAITVTFRDFPGTNDWVAIAATTDAPEKYGSWSWTDKRPSGTLTFNAPGPGSYEVRAFVDWSAGGY